METQEKVQKSREILTFISRLVGTLFAVHWGKEKRGHVFWTNSPK